MTCGPEHTSYSLPEWQAVKLAFLQPVNFFMINISGKIIVNVL